MSEADDLFDVEADAVIAACLNIEQPQSFILHAGAGSGKTRSLVEAIRKVCSGQGRQFQLTKKKIGVITFTNAACDEIKQRLDYDPRVQVSTIHSFAWSLISGYDDDIRIWLEERLTQDIEELEIAQAKGRAASKAAIDRARSIEQKRRRIDALDEIRKFTYSPSGDNRARDALNHSEVISMTADFLAAKTGLKRLLVSQFPFLLIDESQDTNRRLMDALLVVEEEYRDRFCIGLFGDMMQRIYADGKERLAESVPAHWARPSKSMNHRSPVRLIELVNGIRADVDDEIQVPRSDAEDGVVRLFIVPQTVGDRSAIEREIAEKMAEVTGDGDWSGGLEGVKVLALEHAMSARRFGFQDFFEPLYGIQHIRTSLLEGTGAGIGLFTRDILPLVRALQRADRFAVAAIMRRASPLLHRDLLQEAGANQVEALTTAKKACDDLLEIMNAHENPSLREILIFIAESRLFDIPDVLVPFATPDEGESEEVESEAQEEAHEEVSKVSSEIELAGWRLALDAPYDQVEKYDAYVRGESQFDTHQGVKGLEFPRVMVIISDEEARGFMFAYDKLFGAKEKTKADLENEAAGKDTSIDRTRRLFYVTCSRTEKSLAVVYYAADPQGVKREILNKGWFNEEEIEIMNV